MDANELRACADALDRIARTHAMIAPDESEMQHRAATYLRAQADAKPVGYVTANGLRSLRQDDATVLLYAHDYLIRPDHVALYTYPAPAAPQADASRMIDALQSIRAHVEHAPSALAAAIVATCDSVLDALVVLQAEPETFESELRSFAQTPEQAEFVEKVLAAEPRSEPKREPLSDEPTGAPYGIIDPDYGRVYTIARKLAWEEGYAIGLHGSFTRDLDLIAVPWADTACEPEHLIRRIVEATGLKLRDGVGVKPHGRRAWTLLFPAFGDPRFVDISVVPRIGGSDE